MDASVATVRGLQSAHDLDQNVTMALRRPLPPDAEVAILSRVQPYVVNGGHTLKTLSAAFLADLQEDWVAHGKKIFPILREKYPAIYFRGLVALSRVIRIEDTTEGVFDRTLTPEQIMDRLEERVGPEGRKLFEKFIKQVNVLQAKQLAAREEADDERE